MTSLKTVLLVALLALGAPMAASAADLSGAWAVKADFGPKLRYTLLCILSADGPRLAGPCVTAQAPIMRASGRLSSSKMSFSYSTDYNGSGLELKYSGHVEPAGYVKGVVEHSLGTGAFQAAPLTTSADGHAQIWSIDVAFDQLRYTVVCGFKVDGGKIGGPCAATDGSILRATAASDGANVTMDYDTMFEGKPVHVVYAGAVQPGGSLKGVIKAGDTTGAFTAARR